MYMYVPCSGTDLMLGCSTGAVPGDHDRARGAGARVTRKLTLVSEGDKTTYTLNPT